MASPSLKEQSQWDCSSPSRASPQPTAPKTPLTTIICQPLPSSLGQPLPHQSDLPLPAMLTSSSRVASARGTRQPTPSSTPPSPSSVVPVLGSTGIAARTSTHNDDQQLIPIANAASNTSSALRNMGPGGRNRHPNWTPTLYFQGGGDAYASSPNWHHRPTSGDVMMSSSSRFVTTTANEHARTVLHPGRACAASPTGSVCTRHPHAHPSERHAVRSPGIFCTAAADGFTAFAASVRGGARFAGHRSHFVQLMKPVPLLR